MPRQKRNEESQKHNDEEQAAGYSRCVSRMWDQDVQNRQELILISRFMQLTGEAGYSDKDAQPI